MTGETPALGDRVVDRDTDPAERDAAVVVNTPPVTAADWTVHDAFDGEYTVAEFPGNEEYADDAPVAVVVYGDEMDEHAPDYAGDEPLPLADLRADSVSFYAFPAPRLEAVEAAEPDGEDGRDDTDTDEDANAGEPEPGPTLRAVADRLDGGGANVEFAVVSNGDTVARGEYLGEHFTIHSDGRVEGGGALRDRLGIAVEEVKVDL